MAKIPFSIEHREKIESGEYKVETRDGRTARIICWDRKDNNYPIIALSEYGKECLLSYTQNGQHVIGKSNVSDLFLVTPEPELSEWELAIAKYRPPTDSKETIQRIAAELLSLARKQLQPEIDAEIEKAYKNSDSIVYENGILYGKAEALKDMPRWRFSTGCFDDGWINDGVLYYKFHAIPLKTLEELPGFKEDE